MVAPATRLLSSSLRRLKHGEHTKIEPPALAKLSISSLSGANPSSWMSSAYLFWDSRTASVLRNTIVFWLDATAALATTNATVALSVLSLAEVRLTQNFPVPAMSAAPVGSCRDALAISEPCDECSSSAAAGRGTPAFRPSSGTTPGDPAAPQDRARARE